MTALTWFFLAAGGWALAAAAAVAGSGRLPLRLSCALSALAGAAAVAGGVSSLWWGDSRVVSAGAVAGSLQLQASSLQCRAEWRAAARMGMTRPRIHRRHGGSCCLPS